MYFKLYAAHNYSFDHTDIEGWYTDFPALKNYHIIQNGQHFYIQIKYAHELLDLSKALGHPLIIEPAEEWDKKDMTNIYPDKLTIYDSWIE